ncbi:MAG: NAD(P)H-binding protein [Microlunatus sp.]|nr:NAD(P)H-binding protein [Microlunatus sp.]
MATNSDLQVLLGAGPAGTSLAGELARRGHQVRLVNRSAGPAPDGVNRVQGDVSTVDGARTAIEGAAVVYHAVNVPYHLQPALLPGIQEAILGAVEAEGSRLVVLDTLSTLGAAVFPGALTGGEVYGLGNIDLPHSFTDIRDVARGLATLGENPDADGRVWHLPAAPALTVREVLTKIEQKVGWPLNLVIKTEPTPVGPFDKTFMDAYAEMFYQHTEPQIMDSSAIQNRFGLQPTGLDSTLDDTISWYRGLLAAQAA